MKLHRSLMAAAAIACICSTAQAGFYTYTGSTTGGPTFDRPLEDFTELSAFGAGVSYSTLEFSVDVTGDYSFATLGLPVDLALPENTFDTFVLLYEGTFNPAEPLDGGVFANDDLQFPFINISGFTTTLTAGENYSYVVTSFDATTSGQFSTTIGGPGAVTPVPEPSIAGLLALGLGAVGIGRRLSARRSA